MIELIDLVTKLDGETEIEVSDGETSVRGCVDDVIDEALAKFPNTIVDRIFVDDETSVCNARIVITVKEVERIGKWKRLKN